MSVLLFWQGSGNPPLNLTVTPDTTNVILVAPVLRVSYTTPAATTSAAIMVPPVLRLSYPTNYSSQVLAPSVAYYENWNAGIGSPSESANAAHSTSVSYKGAGSVRLTPSASVAYWNAPVTGNRRRIVGSVYIRFDTLPLVNVPRLVSVFVAGESEMGIGYHAATSKFATSFDGSLGASGGPTIVVGQWYRIDFAFDASTTNWTTDGAVDGVALGQSNATRTPSDFPDLRLGDYATTHTADYFFDELHFAYSGAMPVANNTGALAVPPALSHRYVIPATTASCASIPPVLAYSFAVPAATSSALVVPPALAYTLGVPAATSAAIAVPPTLSHTYGVPAATANVAMPDVGLSFTKTYTWDAATATVIAVPPALSHTYAVPAATDVAILYPPTLRLDYASTAATASVSAAAALDLVWSWDAATATVAGGTVGLSYSLSVPAAELTAILVPPTLSVTYGVPAATATGEAVPPGLSETLPVSPATATAEMPDVGLELLDYITLVVDTATVSAAIVAPILDVVVSANTAAVGVEGGTASVNFTLSVPTATAGVAMQDVGFSTTLSVGAATSTVEVVAPALSFSFAVPASEASGISTPPALSYTFQVTPAEASVTGGNVALAGYGEFIVFAATVAAELVAPALSYTYDTEPAESGVEMPDVGLFIGETPDLTVEPAEASVAMADVDITITPIVPTPQPTPGAGGGTLLEFVFNDLDLRVEPATAFVEMIPPMLNVYRRVEKKRFLRKPVVAYETIPQVITAVPEVTFSVQPEHAFFFKVEPAEVLKLSVETHERKFYAFDHTPGKRRRTPEEERYELVLLGFEDDEVDALMLGHSDAMLSA